MALVIADRVKESTASTGTGALALSGAAVGYRAFSAVCSVNDTAFYAIEAVDGNGVATGDWEVGLGTYSAANTFTRTTPQASSNGGSAVSFAVGAKAVWIDCSASQITGFAPLASPTFTGTATSPIYAATTAYRAPDGLISAPGYSFTSATGTGFYIGSGILRLSIGGANTLGFPSTGVQPGAGAGTADLGGVSVGFRKLYIDYTNTATVGAVTINKAAGRVNLGAGGTSLVLTNSFITAASHVVLQLSSAPGNAVAVMLIAVAGAGSVTITATPAVTNQTAIDFFVVNAD